MKKVSILGCGWIGKALKEKLSSIYQVCCLTRDIEYNYFKQYYKCDTLVIAIPPRNNYIEVLDATLSYVYKENKTQVIFLSSISFYKHKSIIIEAEELVLSKFKDVIILRLGGLMGYDRIAGKYTAGKKIKKIIQHIMCIEMML